MDLGITKNDVLVKIRTDRYYNEQEITRLVQTSDLNHQLRVNKIIELTKANVALVEAAKLIEIYFPAQQQQPTKLPVQPDTDQPA